MMLDPMLMIFNFNFYNIEGEGGLPSFTAITVLFPDLKKMTYVKQQNVAPPFLKFKNSRLFQTDNTPTAVAPTAVFL